MPLYTAQEIVDHYVAFSNGAGDLLDAHQDAIMALINRVGQLEALVKDVAAALLGLSETRKTP